MKQNVPLDVYKRQAQDLQRVFAQGGALHVGNVGIDAGGQRDDEGDANDADTAREGREMCIRDSAYSGRALMDYCDERARRGYFAPEGSAARQSGQDFLWYLWCGKLSPLYGRSAMTTFERLYVEDASTQIGRAHV